MAAIRGFGWGLIAHVRFIDQQGGAVGVGGLSLRLPPLSVGGASVRHHAGFPLPPLKFRTSGFPQYGFKRPLLPESAAIWHWLKGTRLCPSPHRMAAYLGPCSIMTRCPEGSRTMAVNVHHLLRIRLLRAPTFSQRTSVTGRLGIEIIRLPFGRSLLGGSPDILFRPLQPGGKQFHAQTQDRFHKSPGASSDPAAKAFCES